MTSVEDVMDVATDYGSGCRSDNLAMGGRKALRDALRDAVEAAIADAVAAKTRVLRDALWKACGDDEDTVNAYIESQT